MKVLILSNDIISLYNYRYELCRMISEKGDKLTVCVPELNDDYSMQDICDKIIALPMDNRSTNPFLDISLYKQYKRIIKDEHPDCVLTIATKPNIWGALACKKMHVKCFSLIQGLGAGLRQKNAVFFVVKFLYKTAMKNVEKVFIEGEDNKNYFLSLKIVSPERIVVLSGPGVNLKRFSFNEMPPIDGDGIRFLYFSRIMKEKGIDELLLAVKKLQHENIDFTLHVIGKCDKHYSETIKKASSDGVIKYHGFQKDVRPFIEHAHCIILPSYHEGVSIALLEGAAMGRPLITTDADGCRECVRTGETGFLVKIKDAEDLYQKMRSFCKLSSEERATMGRLSREYIETTYNRDTVNSFIIEKMNEIH